VLLLVPISSTTRCAKPAVLRPQTVLARPSRETFAAILLLNSLVERKGF
jgi:hypothetical protein